MDPILANEDFDTSFDHIFGDAIVEEVEFNIEDMIDISLDEFDQIVADTMAESSGKNNIFLFLPLLIVFLSYSSFPHTYQTSSSENAANTTYPKTTH